MTLKTSTLARRADLLEYTLARDAIIHAGLAIDTLERISVPEARWCIGKLKVVQERALRRMDKYAERLGAPYPGTK